MLNKTVLECTSGKFTIENIKDRIIISVDRNVFTIWKDRQFYNQLQNALASHLRYQVPVDFKSDEEWVAFTKTLINYYTDRS